MARHMNCILYAQLNIRGYSLTDCTELMIDTSTHTPTFPSIYKSLYLHNVWCLHQHKSNSDASIQAGLVGHGKSLRKGCIPTVLLGLGLELRICYLFMSFLRRTSGCLVSAEQDRNSILPGTCLSEWLIRVQADCYRTLLAKPLAGGRYILRSGFLQHRLSKFGFERWHYFSRT